MNQRAPELVKREFGLKPSETFTHTFGPLGYSKVRFFVQDSKRDRRLVGKIFLC